MGIDIASGQNNCLACAGHWAQHPIQEWTQGRLKEERRKKDNQVGRRERINGWEGEQYRETGKERKKVSSTVYYCGQHFWTADIPISYYN